MPRAWKHVFVVMRAERLPADQPVDLNLYATAKEVVPTEAEAEAEVARLTALNGGKGCTYFFQSAKLHLDGGEKE